MDDTEPKRPLWREKRTWAAVAAIAVVTYAASLGPAWYCLERGWIGRPVFDAYSAPFDAFNEYREWWGDLARRHDGTHPLQQPDDGFSASD
jgi:hypothetical protein